MQKAFFFFFAAFTGNVYEIHTFASANIKLRSYSTPSKGFPNTSFLLIRHIHRYTFMVCVCIVIEREFVLFSTRTTWACAFHNEWHSLSCLKKYCLYLLKQRQSRFFVKVYMLWKHQGEAYRYHTYVPIIWSVLAFFYNKGLYLVPMLN